MFLTGFDTCIVYHIGLALRRNPGHILCVFIFITNICNDNLSTFHHVPFATCKPLPLLRCTSSPCMSIAASLCLLLVASPALASSNTSRKVPQIGFYDPAANGGSFLDVRRSCSILFPNQNRILNVASRPGPGRAAKRHNLWKFGRRYFGGCRGGRRPEELFLVRITTMVELVFVMPNCDPGPSGFQANVSGRPIPANRQPISEMGTVTVP